MKRPILSFTATAVVTALALASGLQSQDEADVLETAKVSYFTIPTGTAVATLARRASREFASRTESRLSKPTRTGTTQFPSAMMRLCL